MPFLRPLAILSALVLLGVASHAQDGAIKIEKFNHSAWTKGIFAEAVTVTGIGNAKFIYLAGVGAEDENGRCAAPSATMATCWSSAATPTTRSSACSRITAPTSTTW